MVRVIVLKIVFSASPKEKHVEIYVYDKDGFIEKTDESSGMEYLRSKYMIEEEYTWFFSNEEKLQEFIDNKVAGYYDRRNLLTLSGYLVRTLNYMHTGISLRNFEKGMIYFGEDGREYVCLAGSTIYDSKWLQVEVLGKYRKNAYEKGSFLMPQRTAFDVMDWYQMKASLVNITGRAELQDYVIEKSRVIFE